MKDRKKKGWSVGLIAGALLLGGMRGVSVPMGKDCGGHDAAG